MGCLQNLKAHSNSQWCFEQKWLGIFGKIHSFGTGPWPTAAISPNSLTILNKAFLVCGPLFILAWQGSIFAKTSAGKWALSLWFPSQKEELKFRSAYVTGTFWRTSFLVNWVRLQQRDGAWQPHPPSYRRGNSARGAPAYFPARLWWMMSGLCPFRHCS